MNYYIQGDTAKAKQIKAAFEAKGYYKSCWSFNIKNAIYYTTNEKIINVECNPFFINLIKTHPDYQELELPVEPKFKVGDWLYHNTYGVHPILVKGYSERQGYKVKCIESSYYIQKGVVENEYHLWSIADAKDGDVLATDNGWTCIFKAFDGCVFSSYCFMDSQKWFCEFGSEAHTLDSRINGNIHPATKEQRDLLFAKIKEAGYQWDVDKKELRKIKPHYDIANFHAGMPVLVRANNDCSWDYSVFSRNTGNEYWHFAVCNGVSFTQCIPFEGNEHLLGTTDMCDERFINW